MDDDVNEFGRFNSKIYGGLPIYIKPTFAWRWNIQAWIFWALGKPIPGDGGDKYIPQGYDIRKVGPRSMAGEGLEQAADLHEALLRRGRCPFRA